MLLSVCVLYICVYVDVCTYVYMCVCMWMHVRREEVKVSVFFSRIFFYFIETGSLIEPGAY